MRAFAVAIAAAIAFVYLHYYFKYPADFQIVQVYLDGLRLETLYEKRPIVVYDRVADAGDLAKTAFAYSYVFKSEFELEPSKLLRNSHKYLLLSAEDDVSVKIVHPVHKKNAAATLAESSAEYATVKLNAGQVLILPALWYYETEHVGVRAIALDDLVSAWLYKVL